MLLVPTDRPPHVEVVTAALHAGAFMPPELAHLLLALAIHYPNIFPTNDALAAYLGDVSPRTVERNLARLHELERAASLRLNRGFGRGGRSWRFLVLPELSPLSAEPVLVGNGPQRWDPAPLRPGESVLLTPAADGRLLPAARPTDVDVGRSLVPTDVSVG